MRGWRRCIVLGCRRPRLLHRSSHDRTYCIAHLHDGRATDYHPRTDPSIYSSIHRRLYELRWHWSYDNMDPAGLIDSSNQLRYSTDVDRYHPRCYKCHYWLDRNYRDKFWDQIES